jgi:hypothetical protein
VREQKDPSSLVAHLRQHRLEVREKARDVEGRAAGLSLVPQIIVGEKVRRRGEQLTQGRPAEGDDRGVGGVRARGGEPLAIIRRAGDRIQE